MKIRRYKKVTKNLNFYINNFKFRQPYQILIDGTFCFVALNNKINIADNIPKYLQGDLKFLTTQCVSIETEDLGRKVSGALHILKKFPLHKCGHEGKPIAGADCLLSMVGNRNENHYFVATQDIDLQNKLRQIPGVPLLYLHQKTPVMEHPSEASTKTASHSCGLGQTEKEMIAALKEKHGIIEIDDKPKKRRRKGPNPLSCKKKKKQATMSGGIQKNVSESKVQQECSRRKVRIPKHVKDEIFNVNKK